MSMGWELVPLIAPVVALLAGFAIGRSTGKSVARIRELGAQVEALGKDCEQAAGELAAAKAEIERGQRELESYRSRVTDHFAGTSEHFRDLSLRYRALFDHLSQGARSLCPDGSPGLEGGPEAPLLSTEAQASDAASPSPGGAEPPAEASATGGKPAPSET